MEGTTVHERRTARGVDRTIPYTEGEEYTNTLALAWHLSLVSWREQQQNKSLHFHQATRLPFRQQGYNSGNEGNIQATRLIFKQRCQQQWDKQLQPSPSAWIFPIAGDLGGCGWDVDCLLILHYLSYRVLVTFVSPSHKSQVTPLPPTP